jgi:hypothetical protein
MTRKSDHGAFGGHFRLSVPAGGGGGNWFFHRVHGRPPVPKQLRSMRSGCALGRKKPVTLPKLTFKGDR